MIFPSICTWSTEMSHFHCTRQHQISQKHTGSPPRLPCLNVAPSPQPAGTGRWYQRLLSVQKDLQRASKDQWRLTPVGSLVCAFMLIPSISTRTRPRVMGETSAHVAESSVAGPTVAAPVPTSVPKNLQSCRKLPRFPIYAEGGQEDANGGPRVRRKV